MILVVRFCGSTGYTIVRMFAGEYFIFIFIFVLSFLSFSGLFVYIRSLELNLEWRFFCGPDKVFVILIGSRP
jgi:hypothetical protein